MEGSQPSHIQLKVSEFLHHSDKYTFHVFVTEYQLTITKEEKVNKTEDEHFDCENADSLEYFIEQRANDALKRKSNLKQRATEDCGNKYMVRKLEDVKKAKYGDANTEECVDGSINIVSSRDVSQQDVDGRSCVYEASDFTSDNSYGDITDHDQTSHAQTSVNSRFPGGLQDVIVRRDFIARSSHFGSQDKELHTVRGEIDNAKSLQPNAINKSIQNLPAQDRQKEINQFNCKEFEPAQHITNNDKGAPIVKSAQKNIVDNNITKDVTNKNVDRYGQSLPAVNNLIDAKRNTVQDESCEEAVADKEMGGKQMPCNWDKCKGEAGHLYSKNESDLGDHFMTMLHEVQLDSFSSGMAECHVCRLICQSSNELKKHLMTHTTERPFKCPVCGVGFRKRSYLKLHESVHMPFTCYLCGESCGNNDSFNTHMLAHTGLSEFKCRFCGVVFDTVSRLGEHIASNKSGLCVRQPFEDHEQKKTDTQQHKQTRPKKVSACHGRLPYECGICKKGFSIPSGLKVHLKKKHSLGRPYQCKECGKDCSNSQELETHKVSHFVGKKFKCGVCIKTFNSLRKLRNHIKEHPRNMSMHCKFCRKGFTLMKDLESHKAVHDIEGTNGKPHQCNVCSKRFYEKKHLENHLLQHTQDDTPNSSSTTNERLFKFKCAVCGKLYSKRTRLRMHVKSHPKVTPHQCTTCGQGFNFRADLLEHDEMHKNERPFKCTLCLRAFVDNWNLQNHMKMHEPEKEHFKCQECLKSFSTFTTLRYHKVKGCGFSETKARVRKPREVGSCACDLCGRVYLRSSIEKHLKFHLQEDRPTCDICGKQFQWLSMLRDHISVHSDLTPFICEQCGKGFKNKNAFRLHSYQCGHTYNCGVCGKLLTRLDTLKRHMKTHYRPKSFPCCICGKSFNLRSSLQAHMGTVHRKLTQKLQ